MLRPPSPQAPAHLRAQARRMRDNQWRLLERVVAQGTLWFTPWNQDGRAEGPDEKRCGLLSGVGYTAWFATHPDWWILGPWDATRAACPLSATAAGVEALAHRDRYDLEPVGIGLSDPTWTVRPDLPEVRYV